MSEVYREEDFYKDSGWPPEEYTYSSYALPVIGDEAASADYDQFALVVNAVFPYIRLAKNRGDRRFPCGLSNSPSTDGFFAKMCEEERDKLCPKIAWGFAAVYLLNLRYDHKQDDYVEIKNRRAVISEYYSKYLKIYLDNHSGLKFSKLSLTQKELNFLEEHEIVVYELWEKSTPLKKYPVLYEYAGAAEKDYELFLQERKETILNQVEDKKEESRRAVIQNGEKSVYVENNTGTIVIGAEMQKKNQYSTEIRESFGKQYLKVFFLNDSIATDAKAVIGNLLCVKTVNVTPSSSADHPGNTLTVYPKSMVSAQDCEKEVTEALNSLFATSSIQNASARSRQTRIEARFNNIEAQILEALSKARVSIHVAMAWFTNQRIADKLVEKFKEGLDVKVVSFKDHTNAKFGVDIDTIPHREIRGTRGGTMHDKFCVVDNQYVITGSYNWSDNAENKNDENSNVIYDDKNASDYSVEFRRLFNSQHDDME